MELLFLVLMILLITAAFALTVFWTVVFVRIGQTARALPTGHDGIALAEARTGPDIPILVVVPAHNEAGTIGPLIRSLREQDHDRFHVVLALDRCTDGTAAVARREIAGDHRFEVVEIDDCPEGWAGKVNAVRVGVEHSAFNPEMLLFTDADCVLHPSCLRAASALAEDRSLDLLSFISEYPPEAWFEYLVQPITGFELLRQYPLLRANRFDDRQRPFANGQFMLFRADFYRQIGGHAAVRDELLEDLALARAVKRGGGRAGALLGGGIVRCRMYETWNQFHRGWRRIFTEAAQRRSARLRTTGWRLRTMQAILPVMSVVLAGAASAACAAWGGSPVPCWFPILIAAAGLFPYTLSMIRVFRMAGITPLAVPLAPIGAWLAGGILLRAANELASGEPTVWGGRAYIRQDRSAARAGNQEAGTA